MPSGEGFQFKQFFVRHDRCAMKVGTDGVLLGALAEGGRKILDIGTGTGLCALMMAQRFGEARIAAIDIDHDACEQARRNITESPFAYRIEVHETPLEDFAKNAPISAKECYDAIISNPPYFEENLWCPDDRRNTARHTSSLPFSQLIECGRKLLTDDGVMTLIIPTDAMQRMEEECAYQGMFIKKRILLKTTVRKTPKRVIIYLTKTPQSPQTIRKILSDNGERSAWYQEITKDFYLDK